MKFSYTKTTESDFFDKESKSKKKKILSVGRGLVWCLVEVWLGYVIFFFFKRIQVGIKKLCSF